MTIQQADTIDFVAFPPTGDEVWLVLVQDEEWGDSGHQLPALQAKVETYLNYALDELATAYPKSTGKRIHVQLRTADPPGEREREFLRIVSKHHFQPEGIRLSWGVIDEDEVHDV